MKILCDHQTGYLPWLGLFHRISLCDIYVSLDTVKYTKSSWDDRNQIITPEGKKWLKIPTVKGESKILKDIKINNSLSWKEDHLKSIKFSYANTPFFDKLFPKIEEMYNKEWEYLMDFNEEMLKFYLNLLRIKVEFYKASEREITGIKNEYLVNLCKEFGADIYVFGQMGKDYSNRELFESNGIKIYIHDYSHPEYEQKNFGKKFVPYLSVIDLLFNVGVEKAKEVICSGNITKEEMLNSIS